MSQNVDQIASLWRDAMERYTSITGVDLETDQDVIRVASAHDLLSKIEAQHVQFAKFRERKATIWKILDQIARGVETIAGIASDAISQSFPPSSVIFAAVSYLIKGAKNVGSAYESIIQLLECLKVFVTRISLHSRYSILPELREIFVRKLSCFLVIFGLSAKLIKEGRALRFVKNILQGGDSSGLQAQINELEMLSKHETDLLNSLSLAVLNEQSATLTSVSKDVADVLKHVETKSLQDSDKDRDGQLRTLKERLNPELSVETDYDNINHDLLPETGDWILSDTTFQEWFDGTTSCLWVSGGPGQGKTYLSARVIRRLMEQYPHGSGAHAPPTTVSYFFCRATNERTRLSSVILRTLAYQIARNDSTYRAYLMNVLKADSETHAGTMHSWKVLFEEFFADKDVQSRLYIVIDGLDEVTREEFEGAETFLRALRPLLLGFRDNPYHPLKILLVGRPEMDATLDILGSFASTITLSGSHRLDVVRYIKNQLARARNSRKLSLTFREAILQKLSDRTFLWAKLVCKEVLSQHWESQMRATLDAFPQDLRATIHHVVERFAENNASDIAILNELLAWVICARRPLTLGEMEVAMAMHSPTCEPILELESLLRKHYSTFFTLIRKDGLGTADLQNTLRRTLGEDSSNSADLNDAHQEGADYEGEYFDDFDVFDSPKDTTVHISHLVFLEYFRSEGQAASIGVDVPKAEVHLLLRCLSLICDKEKVEQWNDGTMMFPHSQYACQHWMSHIENIDIKSVSVGDKHFVASHVHRLFTDEPTTTPGTWWEDERALLPAQVLFRSEATVAAIIRWVTDDDLDSRGIKNWADMIKVDPKVLFAPVMKYSFETSLQSHQDPFSCLCLVYAYMHRFKLYPEGSPFTSGLPIDLNGPWKVAHDDLFTIIEWIGFPKNTASLICIGGMFECFERFEYVKGIAAVDSRASLLEHAVEWYLKAVAIADPPALLLTCQLARTYGQKNNYEKAVEWGRRAMEKYEDKDTDDAFQFAVQVAQWMSELYDTGTATLDETMAQWEAAFQHHLRDSEKPAFVLKYLGRLVDWQEYNRAIAMMQSLADVNWDRPDGVTHNFLVEVIHACSGDRLWPLQQAARSTNAISWFIELCNTALAAATDLPIPRPGHTAGIQLLLGDFILANSDSQDEGHAIELLEEGLAASDLIIPKPSSLSPIFRTRGEAVNYLGEVYYQHALKAEKDGMDPAPCLAKLRRATHRQYSEADLVEVQTSEGPLLWSDFFIPVIHSTDLLLGVWHRLHGEEEEAAQIFRRRISFALSLSRSANRGDSYPDYSPYQSLAYALIAAGDIRGSRAAMNLIGGPVLERSLHTWRAETEVSGIDSSYKAPFLIPGTKEYMMGGTTQCDGPCKRQLFIPHGIHICMDGCLMKTFCSPCLGKLKRRELNYKVCSPDHHWLHATRDGLPNLEEGEVLFVADGDEPEVTMELEEWFTQSKEKWGIGTN